MKKLLLLAMSVLVAAILAFGCAPAKVETYGESAQAVQSRVSSEFIISLESNPTTGYSWQESHDDSMVKLVEKKLEPGAGAKQGLAGAGGVENFRFKAVMAGKTQITLTYKRPWEQQSVKQKIFTIETR